MPGSWKVLIVGGGIAGMSGAIAMAKAGNDVTLIDLDTEWKSYGVGISVQGPMFRALRRIGLEEEVAAAGARCRGARQRLFDGTLINEVVHKNLEPGLPEGGGILRPVLHSIMAGATRGSGVSVRLGLTVKSFGEDGGGVDVTFTDGSTDRFDLIVGSDGIFSQTRSMLFPELPEPWFTGQGAFRVMAPRPPELDMIEAYVGNSIKAGVTPVSQDEMYMFVLSPENGDERTTHEQQVARLQEVLDGFGGLIAEVRDTLGPESRIIYRPLKTIFVEKPWHRGRVILIGDAAHATTPHLASGAGIAVEDGVLLSEYLTDCSTVEEAFAAFTERRFERCRNVVQSSVRLGELELAGAPGEEQARIFGEAIVRLAEPA